MRKSSKRPKFAVAISNILSEFLCAMLAGNVYPVHARAEQRAALLIKPLRKTKLSTLSRKKSNKILRISQSHPLRKLNREGSAPSFYFAQLERRRDGLARTEISAGIAFASVEVRMPRAPQNSEKMAQTQIFKEHSGINALRPSPCAGKVAQCWIVEKILSY